MKTLSRIFSLFFFYFLNLYSILSSQLSSKLKEYSSYDNTMFTLFNKINSPEIEDKPVYLHDWAKYFVSKYSSTQSPLNNSTTQISNIKESQSTEVKDFLISEQPNFFYLNKAFINSDLLKINKDSKDSKDSKDANKEDYLKKDSIGYVNIPSENSFFFILSRKNINILSSRRAETAKTIDLINFTDIEVKQDSNNQLYLGVNDLGVFNEGHCLQIITIKQLSYTICFETQLTKNNWISILSKLLYKKHKEVTVPSSSNLNNLGNLYQHNSNSSHTQLLSNAVNIAVTKTNFKDNTNYEGNSLNTFPNPVSPEKYTTTTNVIKEIKQFNLTPNKNWVAIKAWSQCSRSCGGGKSILERVCIDFSINNNKNNNKDVSTSNCKGEAILTKDCNLHPCSDQNYNIFNKSFGGNTNQPTASSILTTKIFNSLDDTSKAVYDKTVKPIFKFVPISKHYDKYERCVVKSGNLALYIDSGSLKGAKIPTRVLLTNSTLSVYSSDDFNSLLVTHSLGTITELKRLQSDDTCFQIFETGKSSTLCGFVSSNKSLSSLAKEWMEDILYFIKNCSKYYSLQNKSINFKGKSD